MTDLHDFVVDRHHTQQPTNGFCRASAGDGRPGRRAFPTVVEIAERSPDIANQDESGRNRDERQEHDRKTRSYEETTGNPYHLSKGARMLGGLLAVIVVITVTLLFLSGAVRWWSPDH